ncbi:glycosyltransferase [Nakamurella flava]|uniref:Glycosyltransferase n=1 Tax=Nakamurella flava TaxID=2576308 RepID=A0A4U6QMB2_9ACTN|nr:glycosyltransferase [Nakamurella flava]TKV61797.1 glycosyltransferase [Nakamurella flava]
MTKRTRSGQGRRAGRLLGTVATGLALAMVSGLPSGRSVDPATGLVGDRRLPLQRRSHGRGSEPRRHDVAERTSRPGPAADAGGLRILIVTSEAPPVVSGISRTIEHLQKGLTDLGHHVDIVSRADYPAFIRQEVRLSSIGLFWPTLRRRFAAYDVINLHGPVPTMSEVVFLLRSTLHRAQQPTVVYTHHSDLAIAAVQPLCRVYNGIARTLAHRADAVVVSSQAYQRKLHRNGGAPVRLIPWGVDLRGRVGQARSAQAGPLKVLFVGQFRVYKGINVLLDAVAGQDGIELTMVGSGPMKDEVTERVRREGLTNVTLAGRLSDDDLEEAYQRADVIVLPSLTTAEAYGLVLAEGMAAGCVPVASALPGVVEVAAETGIVCPPGDVAALRSAFTGLRDDRHRLATLSQRSLDRSARFSVRSMAQSYAHEFVTAAESAGRRRAGHALPARWSTPAHLLDELLDRIGADEATLTLLCRDGRVQHGQTWAADGSSRRQAAPLARLAGGLSEPVVVRATDTTAGEPTLARLAAALPAGVTSALLVPLRRARGVVSVVQVMTHEGSGRVLDRRDLAACLQVLDLHYDSELLAVPGYSPVIDRRVERGGRHAADEARSA